jgi:hypothetical protein
MQALTILGGAILLAVAMGLIVVKAFIAPLYACPHCRAPQRVYASGVAGRCGRCGK